MVILSSGRVLGSQFSLHLKGVVTGQRRRIQTFKCFSSTLDTVEIDFSDLKSFHRQIPG